LDPSVYEVFDSASVLELNPKVLTLTPETLFILTLSCYRI